MPYIGRRLSYSAERVWDDLWCLKPKLRFIHTREFYDVLCYNHRSLPFDFAVKKRGKLYLIEFSDGKLPHPNASIKREFCGTNNIPLLELSEHDVWGGELYDMLQDFLNTNVIGKQNVNPCRSSRFFWFYEEREPRTVFRQRTEEAAPRLLLDGEHLEPETRVSTTILQTHPQSFERISLTRRAW